MKPARQAPVFKPLSNKDNAQFFNFESQASNSRTSGSVPFMRINENQVTSVQSKQTQQQDVGSERLSSLHAKLHQEADKIRKWKVQTEIELKQKEKKIQEASTTNESLRKSILELQLQNEDLSLKLQEEIGNREDVVQRINSTRQLCNILKDHEVKLEEKLHHCETERTELKYLEKEHLQQFEELSSEFKKLEITTTENNNRLVNQLELERDDRRKLEEEMESKLSEAEIQLKALMDQCDEKDIEIRDVRTMLQKNDEKIHTLEQSIATLKERSERQIADIHSKESDLEAASEQLLSTQKENILYEERLTEISVMLENMKMEKSTVEQSMVSCTTEYDNKLASLQKHNEELNCSLNCAAEKIREYEEQLAEMSLSSENLKSSRDILTLENTKLQDTIAALNRDVTECQKRIVDQTEDSKSLVEENSQLKVELEESKTCSQQLENNIKLQDNRILQKDNENKTLYDQVHALEERLKQKEEMIQTLVSQCEATNNQLQISKADIVQLQLAIEDEKRKAIEAIKSLDIVIEDVTLKSKEIATKDCCINKLKKDCEKLQKDFKSSKEESGKARSSQLTLEREKEQLILKCDELQNLIDELKDEKAEHDKSLDVEMKSKSKLMLDMENKHKELKVEMASKNKQIKELEKEIKGLKSKLTTQTKAAEAKSKEYIELQEEFKMMKINGDNLQSNMMSLNEELETVKSSEKIAMKQMKEMEARCEQALKEKKETEDKCEFQLSEMMATMDKYKKENNKIVHQKEKEIELLKSKSEEFSAQTQKKDYLYEDMKKNVDEMKTSLDAAYSERDELLRRFSDQGKITEDLEKKLMLKEAEIAELQEKERSMVQQVKQKKKLSSHTQTSPALSAVSMMNLKTAVTPEIPNGDDSTLDTQTPQNCLKTPQRSILRNVNSVSKRRKVAFASHDDSGRHSASDSDSSSELMEVEMESVESRYKTNVKSTPLLIRPSPKVRTNAKSPTPDIRTDTAQKTPLVRIPRGPPVKLKDTKQVYVSTPSTVISEEKEMFKQLFPEKKTEMISVKENKSKKTDEDTAYVRKTPSKSTSKFFKASPKDRISKKGKNSGPDEIAWFDLDSVFGFGPED